MKTAQGLVLVGACLLALCASSCMFTELPLELRIKALGLKRRLRDAQGIKDKVLDEVNDYINKKGSKTLY